MVDFSKASACFLGFVMLSLLAFMSSCRSGNPKPQPVVTDSNAPSRSPRREPSDVDKPKSPPMLAPAPVMIFATRDDALLYWKKAMENDPSLSDSESGMVQHIRNLLLEQGAADRWTNFDLMVELLDDRTELLPLVAELAGKSKDDAQLVYDAILKKSDDLETISEFVATAPNDKLRASLGTKLVGKALDHEDVDRLMGLIDTMSGDPKEEALYLKKIGSELSGRWNNRFNRDKTRFSPEFIEALAAKLPEEEARDVRIGAAVESLEFTAAEDLKRLAGTLDVPVEFMVQHFLLSSKYSDNVSADQAVGMIALIPTTVDFDELALDTLARKVIEPSQDMADLSTKVDSLPPKQQEMILPYFAYRIGLDSGRAGAYEFASQLSKPQLDAFMAGLKRVWSDMGEDGPDLATFEKLRK